MTSAAGFSPGRNAAHPGAKRSWRGCAWRKRRADNFLSVLVGGPTRRLPEPLPLAEAGESRAARRGLAVGAAGARPDILAAEELAARARANIGAARAAFFPSIALTGSFGFASTELDTLVGERRPHLELRAGIDLPIFNFGRTAATSTSRSARDIAIANYERTIQTAFQEVSDALAGRRYLAEQVAAQERGVTAQRRIAELARTRYREGVVGYLEVLDAERNLFAAEQALLQVRRAEIANLVALYVALGGGVVDGP